MRAFFFVETPHRLAGAQRSLMVSLTRISNHGIEPLAVFPGPGPVEEAYRESGVPTRVIEAPPSLLLFNKRLLALGTRARVEVLVRELVPYWRALAREIDAGGYEVVHFNTPRGILVGGPAAKLARRPAVLHLRGAADDLGRPYWAAAQILADRIVLVAKAIRSSVSPPFRHRSTVVYNGVRVQPPRDRLAARRALATRLNEPSLATSDEVLFVSLSSLTPFKGLHHLLDAAAVVRRAGIRARYVLAGGGGDTRYERFLLTRRATLGLDDLVHVVGFVPDPLELLAAADAAVLPSVHREMLTIDGEHVDVRGTEGLPRSILESLSLGVPVIASRVQGVVEQIEDEVTGLIVPPGDVGALSDALLRAATDRPWRERVSAMARATVEERFTIDAAAAGLADVLRSAALSRSRGFGATGRRQPPRD